MGRIRKNEGIASEMRTPSGFHLYETSTADSRMQTEYAPPYIYLSNPHDAIIQLINNDNQGNPHIAANGWLVLNSGNGNPIAFNYDNNNPACIHNAISQHYQINYAGAGVVAIYGENSLSAQTATGITITTYIPNAAGNYEISAACDITSYTSGGLEMTVSWTDENGTARVAMLLLASLSGTTSTSAAATGPFSAIPYRLRAAVSTTITVAIAGTFVATYDATAAIKQTG